MHLGSWFFYKLGSLRALMGFLKCPLRIVANLLWSRLCLFDTIVDLYAIDGKKEVQSHPHWNVKMKLCLIKAYLYYCDLYVVYVVKIFITSY